MKVKVSIIVPVYNVYPYLDKCLDSLVNQTLHEIEIIVVNDGTPDQSQEIIDRYAKTDQRVVPLKKENGGLSDARNYGLKYATGEYISFIDSDDYVDVTMMEKMYAKAKKEKCDLVECDCYWEYPDRKVLDQSHIVDNYFVDIRVMAWNKLYKHSLLKKTGILFPKGLQYEDISFCYQLLPYVKKIGYVDEALYYYIQRDTSIANTSNAKVRQVYDNIQLVLDYYQRQGFYEKYEKELEYVVMKLILGRNFYRICALRDRTIRTAYLNEGYQLLESNFPSWKKNKYLQKRGDLHHRYYKCLNPFTYKLSSIIFHYAGDKILKKVRG